jgi:prevent-host-death family protein
MSEVTVGIRDLKARLSEYLRELGKGQVIVITDHGRPVGRIYPAEASVEERMEAMRKAGLVEWSGKELRDIEPPAVNRGDKLVSDIVVEMRE